MNAQPTPPADSGPFAQFRRDHVRVLAQLDELERSMADGAAPPNDEAVLDTLSLLGRQFATHMAAEDAILYPALHEAFPPGRPTLEPLRADHAELRMMLPALVRCVSQPRSERRDEQLGVLLRDFIDLLRLHIHREEAAVFDVASRVLSAGEAEALTVKLRMSLHPDPSGDNASGQPKGSHT